MKKTTGLAIIYFLGFVLIVAGVFCGIRLCNEVKADSYINGAIDIENRFSQETFNYSATSVVFYRDLYDATETYTFEKELLKTEDFNGKKRNYRLVLNDYILLDTTFSAGLALSVFEIDFYDTGGEIVCSAEMDITVEFLSDKTRLTLVTTGKESAGFLEQYFADNGIRLRIIEISEGGESL